MGGILDIVYSNGDTLEFSEDVANEGVILRGLKNVSGNLEDSDAATVGYVNSRISSSGTKILTVNADDTGSSDMEWASASPSQIWEFVQNGYCVLLNYYDSSVYSLDKIDLVNDEAYFGPYVIDAST